MLLIWTKNLLKEYNIKPRKRLGQNFLVDKGVLEKLLDAAEIKNSDTVVEVGAGIGAITVGLAKRAKKVIAVEKDRVLIPILKETAGDFENVEIVQEDILKLPYKLKPINYKLVGNIPYYLTAPLIRKFLEDNNPPQALTLMVQKEMAQRICAKPPRMSILAVSVQVYAKPEIISYVSRSAFWPKPDVDSAIIKIVPHPRECGFNARKFFGVVRAGFSSPRKQLATNLSRELDTNREEADQWLRSSRIDPKRRAETLTVEEWGLLANYPHRSCAPNAPQCGIIHHDEGNKKVFVQ